MADKYVGPLGQNNDDTDIGGSGYNRGEHPDYPYRTIYYAIAGARLNDWAGGETLWIMDMNSVSGTGEFTFNTGAIVSTTTGHDFNDYFQANDYVRITGTSEPTAYVNDGWFQITSITTTTSTGDTLNFAADSFTASTGVDASHVNIDGVHAIQTTENISWGTRSGATATNKSIIKNYNDGSPVIYVNNQKFTFYNSTTNYHTFDGLTLEGVGSNEMAEIGEDGGPTTPADYALGITFKNCTFRNSGAAYNTAGSYALNVQGARDFEVLNCTFDNIRARVADTDTNAIQLAGPIEGALISGNTFNDIGADAILVASTLGTNQDYEKNDIIIENNTYTVTNPYVYRDQMGHVMADTPVYASYNTDSYSFSGHTITRTGSTDDLTVFEIGSTISITSSINNNRAYTVAATTSGTITTREAVTTEISVDCTIESFNGSYVGENFVDCKGGTSNNHIRDNIAIGQRASTPAESDASGSPGSPVSVHVSAEGWDIYRNQFLDCTNAITVGAPDASYYDYPNINAKTNIYSNTWDDTPIVATAHASTPVGLTLAFTKNTKVYNNVFNFGNSDGARLCWMISNNGGDVEPSTEVYNNIFIAPNGVTLVQENSDTVNPTMDNNLWYSVASLDSQLSGPNDITSDPLLDAEHRPTENSPCIGAGTTPLSKFDYWGMPLTNNSYNIGAIWPAFVTSKKRRTL